MGSTLPSAQDHPTLATRHQVTFDPHERTLFAECVSRMLADLKRHGILRHRNGGRFETVKRH